VVQRNRTGNVIRVVVVCRNLTEKKQLRAEVLRNAQLAALGELAAGVAHEINNPINGIINYAQIMIRQTLIKIQNDTFRTNKRICPML